MSFCSFLASRVSVEKSVDSLMGVPLYVIWCFSSVDFNIISVFNFCQFHYLVSQCVPPWVYPAWDSLHFLDLVDHFLSHVREIFSYFSSDIFSSPFSLSSLSAAAAAKSFQLCPTLCDPIEGSPPGFSIPRILQARILDWVAISFSNACIHASSSVHEIL